MRTRATTAQLRSGEVPTIVFGATFARLWEPAEHKAFLRGPGFRQDASPRAYKVIRADNEHLTIACMRQFQNSIHDSSKKVIEHWIERLGLSSRFKSTDQEIWSKHTDTCSASRVWNATSIACGHWKASISVRSMRRGRSLRRQWNADADDPQSWVGDLVSHGTHLIRPTLGTRFYRNPKSRPPNAIVEQVGIEDNPLFLPDAHAV